MTQAKVPPLIETVVNKDGRQGIRYNFHAGQLRAWQSRKRIVAVIAGGRSGKTVLGPPWLHREMIAKGPGDYLIVAPNYLLLQKAAKVEIEHFFGTRLKCGEMRQAPPEFRFSEQGCRALWGYVPDRPARIIFAHAMNPQGLEAMSAKAAWLDEAGQDTFRMTSYQAVEQRCSLDSGRILMTTKPFNLGWLYEKIYEPWRIARKYGGDHPDIDVINYGSASNPTMPVSEIERARQQLPPWQYSMMYEGQFTRPSGRIYECWDRAIHVVEPFDVPDDWPRYGAIDFGGTNTAAIIAAECPESKDIFIVSEYHQGGLSAAGHAKALQALAKVKTRWWVGGARSEGQWRMEFTRGGLHVSAPPVEMMPGAVQSTVEAGINRVRTLLIEGRLKLFSTCERLIADVEAYSREVDDVGDPTEKIADKAAYHHVDALRYLASRLTQNTKPRIVTL